MSAGIQTQELRTFEQRFGKRCPFCGRGWGNPERCDPEPGENWRDTNVALFRQRAEFSERPCVICVRPFRPSTHNAITCSDACNTQHRRNRQNARSRRRNERRRAERAARRAAAVA